MAVEIVEQALDHARLRQLLAVQPHRLGVGHRVLQPEAQKADEGEPVAQLILHLVVRQVVELTQNDCLENHDRVPGLAPRLRLPRRRRLAPHRFQSPAKALPRNQRIDPQQRIVLGIQPGIAPRHVEKAHLTHAAEPRFPCHLAFILPWRDDLRGAGVEECLEITHASRDEIGRRRDKESVAGAGSADPVLAAAKLSGLHVAAAAFGEKHLMNLSDEAKRQREITPKPVETVGHGGDVVGDFLDVIEGNTRRFLVLKQQKV